MLPHQDPGPEEVVLNRERASYLVDAVAALPERLRVVVEGYFFNERPMAEIAAELGVTESRISQMRAEALALLKDGMTAMLAPEELDAESRPDGCVARRKAAYYATIAASSDAKVTIFSKATESLKFILLGVPRSSDTIASKVSADSYKKVGLGVSFPLNKFRRGRARSRSPSALIS